MALEFLGPRGRVSPAGTFSTYLYLHIPGLDFESVNGIYGNRGYGFPDVPSELTFYELFRGRVAGRDPIGGKENLSRGGRRVSDRKCSVDPLNFDGDH